jgi:preprotein translocase subunit Sec63
MMKTVNHFVIMHWRMSGSMWLTPASHRSYVSVIQFPRHLDHCYKLLNVSSSCSDDELRSAYLSLAKLYHPDVHGQMSNPKKFAAIEEAYRMITVIIFHLVLIICVN